MEALAHILLGKLYRKPVPRLYAHRYRLYLNRRDVRRQAHLVRQIRGRKFISGPAGRASRSGRDLRAAERPVLRRADGQAAARLEPAGLRAACWGISTRRTTRSSSAGFSTGPEVPLGALEYVMFHEMLHLRYPVDHTGSRRRVHTREFRQAEKEFPRLDVVKDLLKRL